MIGVTINELLTFAELKGHSVLYANLNANKSFSVEHTSCYIALSDTLTRLEEKECLAHELGHCEYGGFYNPYSPFHSRSKTEHRANKWAYARLVPLGELRLAAAKFSNVYELADYFDVPVALMIRILRYYVNVCGVKL